MAVFLLAPGMACTDGGAPHPASTGGELLQASQEGKLAPTGVAGHLYVAYSPNGGMIGYEALARIDLRSLFFSPLRGVPGYGVSGRDGRVFVDFSSPGRIAELVNDRLVPIPGLEGVEDINSADVSPDGTLLFAQLLRGPPESTRIRTWNPRTQRGRVVARGPAPAVGAMFGEQWGPRGEIAYVSAEGYGHLHPKLVIVEPDGSRRTFPLRPTTRLLWGRTGTLVAPLSGQLQRGYVPPGTSRHSVIVNPSTGATRRLSEGWAALSFSQDGHRLLMARRSFSPPATTLGVATGPDFEAVREIGSIQGVIWNGVWVDAPPVARSAPPGG
ncbi:MAG: hypothetical protein HY775_02205 [Acidobacteria bacterium]|nr:hypothetical protein [Acidobacteriota bacterium]